MDLLKRIIGIILIAAVVTAVVLLVVGFIRSRSASKSVTSLVQTSAQPETNTPTSTENTTQPDSMPQTGNSQKTYVSNGNSFSFPNSWGLLTCSNSANFELDPTNSQDSQMVCDIALKPVTVLVNSNVVCKGAPATVNGATVQKYRVENARGVDYQWCFTRNGVSYNITHRVSQFEVRGTSKDDYSTVIEQMIGNIK